MASVIVRDDGFHEDDLGSEAFSTLDDLKLGAARPSPGLEFGNSADPAAILEYLPAIDTIRIPFPDFTDGRGFSLASRLRQLGFKGRLRASGHLISDQYPQVRRSGFDEVEISEELARRQPEHLWKLPEGWRSSGYQTRILKRG